MVSRRPALAVMVCYFLDLEIFLTYLESHLFHSTVTLVIPSTRETKILPFLDAAADHSWIRYQSA